MSDAGQADDRPGPSDDGLPMFIRTREELAGLTQRVAYLEGEVHGLREARHDHAGRLHALAEAVREIREALRQLSGMPDEVQKLKSRLDVLERAIEHVAARVKSVEDRLARAERRLYGVGTLILILVETVFAVIAHYARS